MSIFLITPINEPEKVSSAVAEKFGGECYQIPKTASWVVFFAGTTVELSDQLGITNGENGTGVVVSIANYYGRAPIDLWEWMKTRMERS